MLYKKLHILEEVERYQEVGIGFYHFNENPAPKGVILTIGTRPGQTFLVTKEEMDRADETGNTDVREGVRLAMFKIEHLRQLSQADLAAIAKEEEDHRNKLWEERRRRFGR